MKIQPELRLTGTEHWVTIVLFICLLLLVWVKAAYPKKLPLLVREVFTGELPVKEKSITPPAVVLFIIFICCLTILILRILPFFLKKPIENFDEEFFIIGLFLLVFYAAKTVLLLLLGVIFDEQSHAWEYITEVYVFAHFFAVLLLPLVAIMVYAYDIDHKVLGEIILSILGLLLVYRTIKMFILMTNKGLKVMYLFLYICALEIVPLALFIKFGLLNYLK
ncbi:MAG TPA: DUF4271 domain-containing protein [Bacteroidia bacterium]|jgi:hypothetical protein|nr:DUF4271 domain-containing protein [Bacteroidia bacterium]